MVRRARRDRGEADPMPISEVLRDLAESRGWEEHLAFGRLLEHWSEVVGDQIAARSHPVKLEGRRLTIRVEPGAWAAELALMAPKLADAAARFLRPQIVDEVAVVTGLPRRS
jgi:predicted nucleic acid-binding Zn ribbon protein